MPISQMKLTFLSFLAFLCAVVFSNAQKIAPAATNDTYKTGLNHSLTVDAPGLLSNDTDANGNATLSVQTAPTNNPSNGTVVLNSDGSFSYTPNNGFVGTDTFTYRVCDDGTPNDIVSRFDFNAAPLTNATIGPNATSIDPNVEQIGCGLYFPSGSGGSTGYDLVIPNSTGIFNFTSFIFSFEYRDQEGTADVVTAGNFRIWHITPNELGLSISVINGTTGLPQVYAITLGSFLAGTVLYNIEYDELTGNVIYTANGTTTISPLAPPNSPLDTSLATDITIGRLMDGSGLTTPSLCSTEFIDTSKSCDVATVSIEVFASIITNRRITYRVSPN